jgi:hypothetical protein
MHHRSAKAVLAALLACLAGASHGGEIYKCVGGGTSYQSAPCARDQVQTRIGVGAVAGEEARVASPPPVAAQRALRPGPWRNTAPVLGITDDEVLNMPAWGRPGRIVRTRLARGWQEVWSYGNPVVGERELRFVNARLADFGDAPPSAVALTSR